MSTNNTEQKDGIFTNIWKGISNFVSRIPTKIENASSPNPQEDIELTDDQLEALKKYNEEHKP